MNNTNNRNLEAALQETERRFRSITQSVPDAIISANENGRILSWNQGAANIFGYREEEVLGESLTIIIPERYHEAHETGIERMNTSGEAHIIGTTVEITGMRRDGSEFPIELSLGTWEAEQTRHYCAVIRNITKRKITEEALLESERRFRSITRSAPDAIISANEYGRILSWNQGAETLFGYEEKEVLDQPLLLIIPEAYHEAHEQGIARVNATGATRIIGTVVEVRGRRKDGSEMPIELSLGTWKTERGRYYCAVIRDITERTQMIEDLEAYTHTVAHDLKNPLGVISGYIEFIEATYMEDLPEELQKRLQIIANTSHKMRSIINEMLLFSSVRQQENIEKAPLVMDEVVAGALVRLSRVIDDTDAQIIQPDHWPVALGYAPWVEEIWANYISNALKYGGSPPVIKLGAETQNGMIRFWVQDNGRGIMKDEQENIFTEFSRLAQHIQSDGHGLGLSIAQRITDKLGGQVGVESTIGEGSTFYFTLPSRGQ